MLTTSNKSETAVHCCDPALSVLVMLVPRKVFQAVSALQSIVCFYADLSAFLIEVPTSQHKNNFIYTTKAVRSLSKQGRLQPHCHSKARSLSRQSKMVYRGFARQPCCMTGTMKTFCIQKKFYSHKKKNLLFLPCNMAAVQNLYWPFISEFARATLSKRVLV